ncbi:MAG: AI-2E family transporter [Gemmatimonadota bacterium]
MKGINAEVGPGGRFLVLMAAAVIVVAGLRAGAPILVPFFLAFFLAILSLPVMLWLREKGLPTPFAIALAVLLDLAILGVVVLLATQSLADLQDRLPGYASRFNAIYQSWIDALQERGIPASQYLTGQLQEIISAAAIIDQVRTLVTWGATFLSAVFIVVLIMVFILAEASIFPAKFRAVLGAGEEDLGRFTKITGEVLDYLVIKTAVSLGTGLCIGVWAWVMGLDFPILLGLIGFALNYVPTIGSILAAIPAVLLAMIQMGGIGPILAVAAGYLVINIIFGNLLEPHLLGRRLGLSTLVVILSLIFWAWVWGPVGALLAVPLTMVMKIMLANTEDLRWIAILLDKEVPREPAAIASRVPGPVPVEPDDAV